MSLSASPGQTAGDTDPSIASQAGVEDCRDVPSTDQAAYETVIGRSARSSAADGLKRLASRRLRVFVPALVWPREARPRPTSRPRQALTLGGDGSGSSGSAFQDRKAW